MKIMKEKDMIPTYDEAAHFKKDIVDIVYKIENEQYIKMIYGFVSQMYKNETGD